MIPRFGAQATRRMKVPLSKMGRTAGWWGGCQELDLGHVRAEMPTGHPRRGAV